MIKTRFIAPVLGLSLLVAAGVMGQPKRNVNAGRHPHIARAQTLSQQAFEQVSQAQQANEFDMEGHAAKAKDLLEQANRELKAAAMAANKNK